MQTRPVQQSQWRQPEDQRGDHSERRGERADTVVERDVFRARHRSRCQGAQRIERPRRNEESQAAAEHGQEQALSQEQSGDSQAARPQGRSHGDLALPRGRAREEETCDVGARDQENQPHGGQENQQRESDVADREVVQRPHAIVETFRRLCMFPRNPSCDGAGIRACGLESGRRFHPAEDVEVADFTILGQRPVDLDGGGWDAVCRQRPHAQVLTVAESGRHHAADRVGRPVQVNHAPDDVRVGLELSLPGFV